MTPDDERALLRWYPASWQARYGPELLAMVDDTLAGDPPPRRLRWSLRLAGAHQHARRLLGAGAARTPEERSRRGASTVLVAWALTLVAGAGYAKASEHWTAGVPAGARTVAAGAHAAVVVVALVGSAALAAATLLALPALRRALAAGAWPSLRRPVLVAVALLAVAVVATAGLAQWAHHLGAADRNGASGWYSAAFVAWGLLLAGVVASWTAAALAVERRLQLSLRLVRIEGIAAGVVAVSTVAVTAGILTWWVQLAIRAPWALAGDPAGTPASAWTWPLGLAAGLSAVAAGVATLGAADLAAAVRAGSTGRSTLHP